MFKMKTYWILTTMIYVPTLKNTLTIGHFVTVSMANGKSFVGQIIGRSNDPTYAQHPNHFVNIQCYLPLFPVFTWRHMNNPTFFPWWVCSTCQCLDFVELVDVSRCAQVNVTSIFTDIAIIFLESEINNQLYCMQGMLNAFIIRFKYSTTRKALKPLNRATFYCFLDL